MHSARTAHSDDHSQSSHQSHQTSHSHRSHRSTRSHSRRNKEKEKEKEKVKESHHSKDSTSCHKCDCDHFQKNKAIAGGNVCLCFHHALQHNQVHDVPSLRRRRRRGSQSSASSQRSSVLDDSAYGSQSGQGSARSRGSDESGETDRSGFSRKSHGGKKSPGGGMLGGLLSRTRKKKKKKERRNSDSDVDEDQELYELEHGSRLVFGKARLAREARLQELRASRDARMEIQLRERVNAILRQVRKKKEADHWRRAFKAEHRSALAYREMLVRARLPTNHAKFAPWFDKSVDMKLMRCSEALAKRMEESYDCDFNRHEQKLSRDQMAALLALQAEEDRRNKRDHREQVAREVRAAYYGVSFPRPDTPKRLDPKDPKERARVNIALDPEDYAPPGQAGQIDRLESRGFHEFFNYWGRWKNGQMCSQFGRYEFADGGSYVGGWEENQMCGMGTAKYPNGTEYTGMWKQSRFHGQGKMMFPSGMVYDGMWFAGKRHGRGKIIYPSGLEYEGEWVRGERGGRGVAIAKSFNKGEYKLNGEWHSGLLRHRGILDLPSGETLTRANWPIASLAGLVTYLDEEKHRLVEAKTAERKKLYGRLEFIKANELAEADRKRRRDAAEKKIADEKLERRAAHQERLEARKAAKKEMMDKVMKEMDEKGELG